MGSLHVKILTSLIPNVQFDIVDDKEIVVPENSKKIDFKNIEKLNVFLKESMMGSSSSN